MAVNFFIHFFVSEKNPEKQEFEGVLDVLKMVTTTQRKSIVTILTLAVKGLLEESQFASHLLCLNYQQAHI